MKSIGLVELKNVSKGIVVTDEMLKSAGVTLISSGSVCPGKFVTIVGGELSAIHAAVDRAVLIAEDALIDKFVIGNLGNNGNKTELERAFGYYGPLRSVWVARNPPGFAFVEFEDPRDAADAVRELDGR